MKVISQVERKERIRYLQRQEIRRKILLKLLPDLSKIVGREIREEEALTLEGIDQHEINLNGSDFEFNYLNISFPKERMNELQEKVGVLLAELSQSNYLCFHQWSEEVVVIKLHTLMAADDIEKLIDLGGGSFYIYNLSYQSGLWVKSYREYWCLEGKAELRDILELRVFGKGWMQKVAGTL